MMRASVEPRACACLQSSHLRLHYIYMYCCDLHVLCMYMYLTYLIHDCSAVATV